MRTNIEINAEGHLVIGGCDTVALAKEFGTPLYVMDEMEIRGRCRRLQEHFINKYPNTMVLYASKAFSNISMYKLIKEEGLGLDVVSGSELYTALKAGFPMEKVYFHGNNKTIDEIVMGIDNNVGCFVIDNYYEMEHIQEYAAQRGKIVKALLRITPGVSGHTHEYISTGQIDTKFGFAVHENMAENAVKKVLTCPNIHFAGLHSHIGSQIYNKEAYKESVKVMTALMQRLKADLGIELEELNMGGGFGVYDIDREHTVDILEFTDDMMSYISERCSELNLNMPRILIEPGRWTVSEAGITLYTIGAIKEIVGIRKYVSVDGGMADNPRPALYQAIYQGIVASKANAECTEVVTIAGRCCESGDVLIRDMNAPKIESGDILAVFGTGAYNYSMSSNYNRLRKPSVVMVKDGIGRVIIKRETYEDIIRNDV